jgi:hypothetical protein
MPNIQFGGAVGVSYLRWSEFKTLAQKKGSVIQCDDDGAVYTLYFIELGVVYACTLWKSAVPETIAVNYSQAANDADKADFLQNFAGAANAAQPQLINQSSAQVVGSLTSIANVSKNREVVITTKDQTTIAEVTHTVSAGKSFYLSLFAASLYSPLPAIVRLRVAGTTVAMVMAGQDSNGVLPYTLGAKIADAGQVITVTYEAQIPRGQLWVSYAGVEI